MRHLLFAVAALFGVAMPASAATVRYRSDAELVARSDRVVRGRVLDSVVERAPSGAIRTRTRIAVLEDFTGGNDAVVTVFERGGRLPDGTEVWIPGAPRFTTGDDVVLCLRQVPGGYRTTSMAFSAFRVGAARPDTEQPLIRFDGLTVVGGAPAASASPEASRTLAGFRRTASSATGAASRAVLSESAAASAVAAARSARIDQPFTLLGNGIRWRQVDSGTPIAWYRNTFRPSPILGADTDDQIRAGLAGWTNPPQAAIVLSFGGTRNVAITDTSGVDPYCNSGNAGVGLISFGDPLNDLGGPEDGILAIGGGCATAETHVVNNQVFNAFSHGLVVLNDDPALEGFRTVPNITRILEHEIGHAIGLDHTDQGPDNIMYPSCCLPQMPVPPAIGADDLAGLVFIYPLPVCTFTLAPSGTVDSGPAGGLIPYTLTASAPSCAWAASTGEPWLAIVGPASGVGSGTVTVLVPPLLAQAGQRTTTLAVGPVSAVVRQFGDADADADGLFDGWASFYGLNPATTEGAPGGDADGDGVSNLAEQAAGTHPRGTVSRYLAEGAGNAFFDTEIALFNPEIAAAHVLLRIQPDQGAEIAWPLLLPGRTRRTMSAVLLESLVVGSFSTLVESDAPVVVDRTMRWDASGYGAHAESAVTAPSTTWYLAEGSTSGEFALFYLLQNPGSTAATATVRFLRPAGQAPIERSYTVGPRSRLTIPVDSAAPELANTDVSGVVTATQPIVVERSMYLNRPGQPFAAGHESAGVTAPATAWFLAEGSTGSFFDLFLLIANPSPMAAAVQVDYLLPSGTVLSKSYAVAAQSRYTVYVDDEQLPAGSGMRPLANTAVAMRVTSTNTVPIIVERAMWWPQPAWYEAHNAAGTTVTGTRWATAGGAVGGATAAETFILIANTGASAGSARVWVAFEDGMALAHEIALPAQSRTNVPVSGLSPMTARQPFSVLVESLGASPAPIVVERATYDNPGGVTWAAGTAVVATRVSP